MSSFMIRMRDWTWELRARILKRRHGRVGGLIRVVDGGSIDRDVILPHGQEIAHGEGLAMPNDHAHDLAIRRTHEWDAGVHSHLAQADLIARTIAMDLRADGQAALVGPPPQLSRGDAFLMKIPATDQVLTNSSTSLGRLLIWVSRSETWMTFVPVSIASRG